MAPRQRFTRQLVPLLVRLLRPRGWEEHRGGSPAGAVCCGCAPRAPARCRAKAYQGAATPRDTPCRWIGRRDGELGLLARIP